MPTKGPKCGRKKKIENEECRKTQEYFKTVMKLAALCSVMMAVEAGMDIFLRRTSYSQDRLTTTSMFISSNLVLVILYMSVLKYMNAIKLILVSFLLSLSALLVMENAIEKAAIKEALFVYWPIYYVKLVVLRILTSLQQECKQRGLF